jgi:hypothetical protein
MPSSKFEQPRTQPVTIWEECSQHRILVLPCSVNNRTPQRDISSVSAGAQTVSLSEQCVVPGTCHILVPRLLVSQLLSETDLTSGLFLASLKRCKNIQQRQSRSSSRSYSSITARAPESSPCSQLTKTAPGDNPWRYERLRANVAS